MKITPIGVVTALASLFLSVYAFALSPVLPITVKEVAPMAPVAKKVPKTFDNFGEKRVDDYYWLREKTNPDTIAYLTAENAHTDAAMAPHAALRETLYKDMLSRIKETDENVPYKKGEYYYYSRTEMGKQYAIYARKKGSLTAPEEVMLDLNVLAEGKKFLGIGGLTVSPNGKQLAYSVDFTGFRQYTLQVKNLETGKNWDNKAERVTSFVWANDNATLFFVTEDATTKRSNLLHRQKLGDATDTVLFEEKDELYNVGIEATRSRGYLILTAESSETNEQYLLDANKPEGKFESYLARRENIKNNIDHNGKYFYIVTNDRGRNFRLVRAGLGKAQPKRWEELIAHRKDVKLDGVDMFEKFYVAIEKNKGLPTLTIHNLADKKSHAISFPEPAYDAEPNQNAEFNTSTYRFGYQSMVTPQSVFDYDIAKRTRELKKQTPVLGNYVATEYQSERIMAKAADGTLVPVSLVYKKALRKTGTPQPTLLYAYGSYGYSLPISFRSSRLALLDRGVVFAIAHIRGGGEMGKAWHDDGKMMKKKNTFTDFTDAAEFLIAQKYTAPNMLAIQGGSAGGLLMGAVSNMRPDLFKAVVSQVPFVDVMNTMLDASLPLTVGEYLEWGNPTQEAAYKYMRSYSPYDNLSAKAYPAMLVETSLNDSQVMYWEPAKYVAKLRTLKTDSNPLLLKTNMDAGHGGASGRYDYLKELAYTYSFVLTQLGIDK